MVGYEAHPMRQKRRRLYLLYYLNIIPMNASFAVQFTYDWFAKYLEKLSERL